MEIITTHISSVFILKPKVFVDHRGYFFESFNQKEFDKHCPNINFVQDNQSYSSFAVLRGLHLQLGPYAQSKLVRVAEGKILDVALDLRRDSKTYGRYLAVELSHENNLQVFIPKGFAHGFVVLSPHALVQYKCDNYYMPDYQLSLSWDDPDLNINWGLDKAEIITSEKDSMDSISFKEYEKRYL